MWYKPLSNLVSDSSMQVMRTSLNMSITEILLSINPLYTGRLFHCLMLDESICHFRSVMSNLSLFFNFYWKILFANNLDPDQMPHDVASDLGLHCLPVTLIRVFRYNRLH